MFNGTRRSRYRAGPGPCTASLCALLLPGVALAFGAPPPLDENATLLRIMPIAKVRLAPPATQRTTSMEQRSGEELYRSVCSTCHDTGVAGAPKTGDRQAWGSRIALGLDALVSSARAGKNAMPPKGGSNASDEELRRAILFIANQSGANFRQ